MPQARLRGRLLWPLLVAATVAVVYTAYSAWQWQHYAVRSWDLSIFTQLLQRYAAFEAPIVTVKGEGFNLLGDHFHPLLVVLAPLYALFPHAFTLLVVQNLCFGLAAGLLTRAAIARLGVLRGVLIGLAYGFSWGLQYAVDAQFHEIALAVPLLTAGLLAVLEGRTRQALLWIGLLVFVKEDLGLTVAVIGGLLALRGRESRWPGAGLAVWGVGWFLLATQVVLPLLNPHSSWDYQDNLDPVQILADPASFFHPAKITTLLLLVAVTGGIGLLSPIALAALPTLAWRFLSPNEGYWDPDWHYSAVLMPIAFVALLDGLGRAERSGLRWLRGYATQVPAVVVTVAVMLLPTLPLASLVDAGELAPAARAVDAETVLAAVPAGAAVESDIGLMSYLVDEHAVYWIGNENPVPDCILIDRQGGGVPEAWGDVTQIAADRYPDVAFELLIASSGYELACRA